MAAQERLAQARAAAAPLIAIASGKGGVGKTWMATSLACAFGRARRATLLVDCDLGLANVDVQLGVRPQADLSSVVRGWLDLSAAVTPIMGGPTAGGFDILPGHSGSGALANLKLEDVHRIANGLQTLSPHYDRILLDLSAGIDAPVMRFVRASDAVLIVTTEDPTALTDAYALMKIMRLQNTGHTPHVLINMADTRLSGRRVFDQLAKACETYLGVAPHCAGIICRDTRVVDSIRHQTPLALRHPQSQTFEDVLKVAETLNASLKRFAAR
jgi:flagellar biosynthesis protein FlhG